MEKKFPRNIDALAAIFEYTAAFSRQNNFDAAVKYAIDLAIEELFTNIVKYRQESTRDVVISLSIEDRHLFVRLIDEDVEPFDISQTPAVDIQQPLAERPIGGLGLHIIKQVMDDIQYEYQNRQSKITLVKKL